jgi:uncharacterized protein
MSKLILGTAQMGFDYGINNRGGAIPIDQSITILKEAQSKNVDILDTAIGYGKAHEIIGKYHMMGGVPFRTITKFHLQGDDPHKLNETIDKEIQALYVKKLHGVLFHSATDFLNQPKNFSKLRDLKANDKIDKVGVSLYSNDELEQVMKVDGVDVIQFPFNVLDNFKIRGSLMQSAKEDGIELQIRSVYLQGIFFKETQTLTGNLIMLRDAIDKIQRIAIDNQIELQRLLMSYAYSKNEIDGVIVGVDSLGQLNENINCVDNLIFDKEIFNEIESLQCDPLLLNPSNWKP